jgi:hypothetical protein
MNASTYSWEVRIQGDQFDLEHLARHFESSDVSVSKSDRDDCYVLRAAQFASCVTSEEVLSVAESELAIISGVLKLVIESRQPLHAGTAYKIHADGRREIFIHVSETLVLRDECEASLIDAQGNVVAPSVTLSWTTAIAAIAKTDSAVAKTMRLLAAQDAATWVNLYRIYEVIEDDVGGESGLRQHGWAPESERRRFKHSANSVAAAGDSARHGKELTQTPVNPMSIEEAKAYVNYLLHAWLATKQQRLVAVAGEEDKGSSLAN